MGKSFSCESVSSRQAQMLAIRRFEPSQAGFSYQGMWIVSGAGVGKVDCLQSRLASSNDAAKRSRLFRRLGLRMLFAAERITLPLSALTAKGRGKAAEAFALSWCWGMTSMRILRNWDSSGSLRIRRWISARWKRNLVSHALEGAQIERVFSLLRQIALQRPRISSGNNGWSSLFMRSIWHVCRPMLDRRLPCDASCTKTDIMRMLPMRFFPVGDPIEAIVHWQ